MNLRQWARATRKAIASQPPEFRQTDFSMADVEMILRQGINVLIESLCRGDNLRLNNLGRLWVEHRGSYKMISNLPGQNRHYDLEARRTLRFQASAKLLTIIRSGATTLDSHRQEDR